jgi:hypothetical protein
MAVLAGCATAPSAPESAAPAPSVRGGDPARRVRSQQELLAAYWAERRAPRVLTASDFFTADFNARQSDGRPELSRELMTLKTSRGSIRSGSSAKVLRPAKRVRAATTAVGVRGMGVAGCLDSGAH